MVRDNSGSSGSREILRRVIPSEETNSAPSSVSSAATITNSPSTTSTSRANHPRVWAIRDAMCPVLARAFVRGPDRQPSSVVPCHPVGVPELRDPGQSGGLLESLGSFPLHGPFDDLSLGYGRRNRHGGVLREGGAVVVLVVAVMDVAVAPVPDLEETTITTATTVEPAAAIHILGTGDLGPSPWVFCPRTGPSSCTIASLSGTSA